ncbi:MAG: FHA domain-containing protein, partial [Steroidobacteraceae bacterium]|nr:FHA domain-containing protein [Steroidobacteraceae bacterium]
KVLRIILAGQPDLNEKLDAPEMVQLAQRIRLRFHLTALSQADLESYIKHRLNVAGAMDRELFAPDVYEKIYRYTGGVPRLINTLCDTALLAAFTADKQQVDMATLDAAIEELQWVEWSARTNLQRRPSFAERYALPERHPSDSRGPVVARVILTSEGQYISELSLRIGRKIIGRTADNDIQIDNRFISRHHCQIISGVHHCVIEDLNSTNGIFVRQRRVRRYTLRDGDIVTIGRHELTYIDERAQNQPPASSDSLPEVQTTVLNQAVE